MRIVKVAPSPSFEATEMTPPCISTKRLVIERPRPVPPFSRVPPYLRAVLASACWNASKMRAYPQGLCLALCP